MQSTSYVSPLKAWWTVFVLFIAYIFSNLDRNVLSLLVPSLKADLNVTDTQIGLLSGVAFAIFYATMAVPIARASDSRSRRAIISWGIVVWSLATAASGLATRYMHLFLARMGVGVGEAVLTPASISLIADIFPKEKRGFALGVLGSANYLGGGLALLLGSAAITWVASLGPLWGGLKPWQAVFMIVGLPGLLVAFLMLTIVEPRHRQTEKQPAGNLRDLKDFISARPLLFTCHFLGFSLEGAVAYAVAVWGPTFFVRHFHLTASEAGLVLGPFLLVAGPLGGLIGGWLVAHWTKKGRDDAPMLTGLLGTVLVCLAIAIAPLMPSVIGAAFFFGLSYAAGPLAALGAFAALQLVTPVKLRAQVVALYYFVVTIVSIVGGATIVALFTDYLFRAEAAIGYSISLTAILLGPLATLLLWISLKPFARMAQDADA